MSEWVSIKMRTIIILICIAIISGCTIQEGQKIGYLVKVSREGLIWSTYEVEIIKGGFDNGSGSNGREFHATLSHKKNPLTYKAIDLMNKNKFITLSYYCKFLYLPWNSRSGCFVDGINEHEK